MASLSMFHAPHTNASFDDIMRGWDELYSQHAEKFEDALGGAHRAQDIVESNPNVLDAMWAFVEDDSIHDLADAPVLDYDHNEMHATYSPGLRGDETDGIIARMKMNNLTVGDVTLREGSADVVKMEYGIADVRMARTQDHVRVTITSPIGWAVTAAKIRLGLRINVPFGIGKGRGHLQPFYLDSDELRTIRTSDSAGPERTRKEDFRKGDGNNNVKLEGTSVHTSGVHGEVNPNRMNATAWESIFFGTHAALDGHRATVSCRGASVYRLQAFVDDIVLDEVEGRRGNLIPRGNPFRY